MSDDLVKKLVHYWENLTPEDVERIDRIYDESAAFQDPFNSVQGLSALKHIFNDMFVRLHEPTFVVTSTIQEDNRVLLVWDFGFCIKSLNPTMRRNIHGTSLITFDTNGLVKSHRDYWDVAGELYEQLPIVGSLMRWLKKRAG